jgi:hypothetical protein
MYKIGLDIDGVLAQYSLGMIDKAKELGLAGYPDHPDNVNYWDHLSDCGDLWAKVKHDEDFWMGLKPFPGTLPLDFEVCRYITARPIRDEVSYCWLYLNGFPHPERLITVGSPEQKLDVIKTLGINVFVDDKIETVSELQDNGINAFLFHAPYQKGHPHTLTTIRSLRDLCLYL